MPKHYSQQFQATAPDIGLIFLDGTNILFADEIVSSEEIDKTLKNVWGRRIAKSECTVSALIINPLLP